MGINLLSKKTTFFISNILVLGLLETKLLRLEELVDDSLSELLEFSFDDSGILSSLAGELNVVLELGLSTGATKGGNTSIGESEGDHLSATRNGKRGLLVGRGGVVAGRGEIADSADFKATTVLRVLTIIANFTKDEGQLGRVVAEEVAVVGGVVAELALKALKFAIHSRSTGIQITGHFSKDGSSAHTILVPAGVTDHVSDGLFEGENGDTTFFLGVAANVAEPLESSQCLAELKAFLLRQCANHLGRHGRVDHEHFGAINVRVSLEIRIPRPRRKQHTKLVTGKDLPSSILELLGSSQAVGIRIVGDDNGRVFGIGSFKSQFQGSLALLRIGEGNGREVRVGVDLLRDRDVGLETEGLEGELNGFGANAVHRRVGNIELTSTIIALMEVPFGNLGEVSFDDLLEGIRDEGGVNSVERFFGGDALGSAFSTKHPGLKVLLDALLDSTIVRLDNLRTILPVDLVAVVVFGVVRSGDHHADCSLLQQYSVRNVGGWDKIREEVYIEALMSESARSVGGKSARVVTSVVANNDSALLGIGDGALSVYGEALFEIVIGVRI